MVEGNAAAALPRQAATVSLLAVSVAAFLLYQTTALVLGGPANRQIALSLSIPRVSGDVALPVFGTAPVLQLGQPAVTPGTQRRAASEPAWERPITHAVGIAPRPQPGPQPSIVQSPATTTNRPAASALMLTPATTIILPPSTRTVLSSLGTGSSLAPTSTTALGSPAQAPGVLAVDRIGSLALERGVAAVQDVENGDAADRAVAAQADTGNLGTDR
ncbi:MAG TPA: hypothetical protein VET65_10120 [Candidatus Limnocylindrales bacterium]|nr:hypothetical protein [Candidatus Limnocylindrales bacterium]